MLKSFLWFDFETFGTNPATDWPSQFAAIRTDADLNEIGEPVNLFCKFPEDHLPHPMATLVTGLTPQAVNARGMAEPEFIQRILDELMVPGTCAVGYNTIRFDDEVIRNSLYRNFHDPYLRERANGNSRWDLIDLVRMTGALRPEGIQWPKREDGFNSYKLEELTKANGIEHGDAHDALSDVRATIAMARLIRDKQPKLFQFYLDHRFKDKAGALLDLHTKAPLVHVSGMFGAAKHCLAVVMPLAGHPVNRNQVFVYDLSVDPTPLLAMSVEEIQENLFTPRQEGDTRERIPLKGVSLNKCPALAPLKVLQAADQTRLGIDLDACFRHREILLSHPELVEKIQAVFSGSPRKETEDPDQMLYSGGFFSWADKDKMERIREASPESLGHLQLAFEDGRLDEMLFRYRGRHYPETLTQEELSQWHAFRRQRLSDEDQAVLGFGRFWSDLDIARQEASVSDRELLDQLAAYADQLQAGLTH
ncbi:exonuclease I [Endozoicomonas montiporae]|uniref:Exodeoxyribonuclease I n=2 Tax=Endozoicomonas montiporae TaxID=1027273 RepID=A0A081N5J9_9GAMM|nr:exodeoxyribonuclease I [Endozoicomonas montiporae]AMO57386.1 exodeoxyribonuclease I [Endozoicomonas montiporae CL-33]KEQ13722.1 exonuclease I [Endozoicomonas montiporae]